MAAKISEELRRVLEQAKPGSEIPVIVTLEADADRGRLTKLGLKIAHAYENIPSVSGTLTPAALERIAELEGVERIELDGEFEALRQPGKARA